MPHMLYRIQIGAVRWPIVNVLDLVLLKPCHCWFRLVLWVVILLKVNGALVHTIVLQRFHVSCSKNMLVHQGVHGTIVYLARISWSLTGYTSPHDRFAATMLHWKIYVVWTKDITRLGPIVSAAIRSPNVDLRFIGEHYLMPLLYGPILILLCPC